MASNKKSAIVKNISKNIKLINSVSRQSQIAEKLLWLSRVKTDFQSVEAADKMISNRFEKNRLKRNLPKLKSKVFIDESYSNEVFTFGNNESKEIIIYLHGGAYINQPARFHWKFIDNIVVKTDYKIVFPLYPKAPEFNYKDSYNYLEQVYLDLINGDVNKLIIMGDSAGGGLALGFTQYLKEKKIRIPDKMILLSPWVDLTMSNPKINKLEKVDPMLSKDGLLEIAKVWANGTSFTDYRLSPINGEFKDLNEVSIFVGTHEIFLEDCRELYKKLEESNVNINYFEYSNMNHCFPLFPIPEAKKATTQIINIIKKD